MNIKKLVDAYDGDTHWFNEITVQLFNTKEYDEDTKNKAYNIIEILYGLNSALIVTETYENVTEYNGEIHELYAKIKLDLTTLLDINEFWEMV